MRKPLTRQEQDPGHALRRTAVVPPLPACTILEQVADDLAILYKLGPVDRYLVFGNPVAHSLSPDIHALFAASLGERISYERMLVPAGEFAAHAKRFFEEGGRGANVTLPFKVDAFEFSSRASERARLAGAANFLAARDGTIEADNTDGAGLVADLARNHRFELRGARIVLLGAGGAARGVVGPLLAQHPASLTIANRTRERAVELARAFAPLGPVRVCDVNELPGDATLLINATSTSTKAEPLPIPDGVLHPGLLVYDMAYGAASRAFLARARAAGARAADGLGMLVEQAAESYFLWRCRRPATDAVLAELRARTS
jgi:shikimate dehydrogenase